METSVLLSVLILGLSFVLEFDFSAAHPLQEADNRSNAATLFELFIEELYELHYENKVMAEKIAVLEGKLEPSQSPVETPTTEAHVGFTVKNPKANTNPQTFQTAVYNSEPGFNTATGKFVCQHPGMYLFTATVIRDDETNEASCHITVNGSTKLRVLANNNNSDREGFPSGSGTLVVHLNTGDEVYLSYCSGSSYMYRESSFSGILIQPDVD